MRRSIVRELFDADKPRIQVQCENGCEIYEKAYSDLQSLPFFDHPVTGLPP
jgi:hypothetical protein